MSVGGRPRRVRSKPLSGVGGRRFSEDEKRRIVEACEDHGLDAADKELTQALVELIWDAYGSYQATDEALRQQVGVAEEMRDIETLLLRAQAVLPLLEGGYEKVDDNHCCKVAAELVESLQSFPNLVEAETTRRPDRERFMHGKRELEFHLARVRLWDTHRERFADNVKLLIEVCRQVERPRTFTKRSLIARRWLQRALNGIYGTHLHPLKLKEWRMRQDGTGEANNPPPQPSGSVFARAIMKILKVPFEVKEVSG